MAADILWVEGPVMKATGIASGTRGCQEIGGSILAQKPFFKKAGIDLDWTFNGTLNVNISPKQFRPLKPTVTVRNVKWHPEWKAEDFSLFCVKVKHKNEKFDGYLYYPHPDTKPTEFLGHNMLEIITKHLRGIRYGDSLSVGIPDGNIEIY